MNSRSRYGPVESSVAMLFSLLLLWVGALALISMLVGLLWLMYAGFRALEGLLF